MELTEAQFQAQVVQLAHLRGWHTYHTHNSKRSSPGWPDLVLVHPRKHQVLHRELKTDTGRLSKQQDFWLRTLAEAGADVDVWRPADWDRVQETL